MKQRGFAPVLFLLSMTVLGGLVVVTILSYKNMPNKITKPATTYIPTLLPIKNTPTPTPVACGGIAGLKCEEGYECKVTDTYPDAMGSCIPI